MARHSQGEAQRRRAEEPSRSASACMGGAGLFGQATSEHHLPPWGMKPTVLDRRNLLDLHTLTRTH
jgi:hypothetical protein